MTNKRLNVAPAQLSVGLYVVLPLKWSEHPFLFRRFKIRNEQQLALIRGLGLKQVEVWLDKSDTGLQPTTELRPQQSASEDERQQAQERKEAQISRQQQQARALQKAAADFQQALATVKGIVSDVKRNGDGAISNANRLVDALVDAINGRDDVVLQLINDDSTDGGIYHHSLNVAVLSVMLASAAELAPEQIHLAGLAGLFHDLGKSRIPMAVLKKTHDITQAEKNLIAQHPKYGEELAQTLAGLPEDVTAVIAQHHERLDGSGYPQGLNGDAISPLAQLVAVANEYDSLCHGHRHSPPMAPDRVLSSLFKEGQTRFNKDYVQHLVRVLGVYPPGTLVWLSNEMPGIVMSVNGRRLLSPSVLIYDPAIPREQAAIIDLEDEGLSVIKPLRPSQLKEDVVLYLKPRTRLSYFMELGKKR